MPSGFFIGGLGRGLSQAFQDMQAIQSQKEQLKLKDRQLKLDEEKQRFEMTEMQRRIAEMDREDQAVNKILENFNQPQQTEQVQTDVGDNPVGLTPARVEMSPQERQGLMIQATPRARRGQLFEAMMGVGAKDRTGFATPEDAARFRQSPTFKDLFPHGARAHQGNQGWTFSGVHPVDAANERYHATLQATGDPAQAEAARNQMLFGNSAARGAGSVAGTAGQTLGEPIQSMQPLPSSRPQVAPAPIAPSTPQVGAAPPQARGGESPALRVTREKKKIEVQESPIPEGAADAIRGSQDILADISQAMGIIGKNPRALQTIGPLEGLRSGARETFGETPIVGDLLGGPIGDDESAIRTAVSRIRNVIRKERFGATLTNNERAEAEGELVSLYKSPATLVQRLTNLRRIFNGVLARQQATPSLTRGNVGGAGAPQQPRQPTIISITPVGP